MASILRAAVLMALGLAMQSPAFSAALADPARKLAPIGSVLLAGGALRDDNRPLWMAFYQHVRLSSGKVRPRIAVFGSARPSLAKARDAFEQDAPQGLSYGSLFRRYGFDPAFVPVALENFRTAAADPRHVALVDAADAVWFGGGNQDFHARCLLNDDGSDSPVMAAVRRVHSRGGVIGGTSAGAAVMDEFTYGGGTSRDYLAQNALAFKPLPMIPGGASPDPEGRTLAGGYTRGFGFVTPLDAAVDTHTDARGRYGRMLVAMRVLDYRHGVAIAEDTALLIRGARGTVYGTGRVLIADARQASYLPGRPFQVTGVLLNSLRARDAYDFETGAVLTAKPPLPPAPSRAASPVGDVLDRDRLLDAMEGLATSAPEAMASEIVLPQGRLRLQLGKTPETRVFHDPATGRFAVQGVSLSLTEAPR